MFTSGKRRRLTKGSFLLGSEKNRKIKIHMSRSCRSMASATTTIFAEFQPLQLPKSENSDHVQATWIISLSLRLYYSEFLELLRLYYSTYGLGWASKKFSVRRSCGCNEVIPGLNTTSIGFHRQHNLCWRLCSPPNRDLESLISKPTWVARSGLEASITDSKGNEVTLKNAKVVVESQDDNKIQLRVDLTGDETQKVFDRVLANLARSAPPIPGFRRQKGGKTSNVPKSFLLDILGEERVTKFVIQEILSSTVADFVKKESLNVKEKKINTTQTAEELKTLFTPGSEFGFNAVLELESSENETSS